MSPKTRLGDEERRLMHLVPAPAVRLMKRRVLSRPGVNSLMVLIFPTPGLISSFPFLCLLSEGLFFPALTPLPLFVDRAR